MNSRSGIRKTMAVLMAASCLYSGAAFAQAEPVGSEDEDKVSARDILVIGRGYDPNEAGAKSLAPIRETPSSITVVDRERMESQGLDDIADLLGKTAGVASSTVYSSNPRFFSRGFEITSYLLDGVPQTGFAAHPYSLPDLFLYDRVEFLRGPAALFAGSGSPGGSINLVRKRPLDDFAFSGSVKAGSWDFIRAEADLSVPLNSSGTIKARGGVMWQDSKSYIDYYNDDRFTVYGALELDLGDSTTLNLGGFYDEANSTGFYGLPAHETEGLIDLPRSTFTGGSSKDTRYTTKLSHLYGQLTHRLGDRWEARSSVQYNSSRGTQIVAWNADLVTDANGGILPLQFVSGKHKPHSLSADVNVVGDFDFLGNVSGVIFGADYQRSKWPYAANYLDPAQTNRTIDVFNPVPPRMPALPVGPDSPEFDEGTEVRTQYGIYGQARIKPVESLTLIAGGRLAWVSYAYAGFDDINGNYAVSGKLTPYLGVTYDLAKNWTIYTSYAKVFEPQSALDRDNRPIGPLSGSQFEVGMKANLFSDKFLASIAFYQLRQTNRAVADPLDINASIGSGKVQARGIEIDLNGQITPNWSISGGYVYTKTKTLSDPDPALVGVPFVTIVPKHNVKIYTDYEFPEGGQLAGLGLGGALRIDSAKSSSGLRQEGFVLVDLRASYKLTPNISVAVNVENIFDKAYYSDIFIPLLGNFYGKPRSAYVTLRAKY